MQGPDTQRRAEARRQTFEMAAGLGKRNGVFRQRRPGIHRDQRQVGFSRGNLFCEGLEAGLRDRGHRHENRGGLDLLDGA
jgi:hypothetical protein